MFLKGGDRFRVDCYIMPPRKILCFCIHLLEGLEIRLVQFVLAGSAFSSWTGPVAILASTVWYPVCSPGKLQLSKWEKNARETLGVMNQHPILLEAIRQDEVVGAHHSLVKRIMSEISHVKRSQNCC